jgi:hypothetical protein
LSAPANLAANQPGSSMWTPGTCDIPAASLYGHQAEPHQGAAASMHQPRQGRKCRRRGSPLCAANRTPHPQEFLGDLVGHCLTLNVQRATASPKPEEPKGSCTRAPLSCLSLRRKVLSAPADLAANQPGSSMWTPGTRCDIPAASLYGHQAEPHQGAAASMHQPRQGRKCRRRGSPLCAANRTPHPQEFLSDLVGHCLTLNVQRATASPKPEEPVVRPVEHHQLGSDRHKFEPAEDQVAGAVLGTVGGIKVVSRSVK